MTILKRSEAKAHLGKDARNVAKGERYVIADHNKPLAIVNGWEVATADSTFADYPLQTLI